MKKCLYSLVLLLLSLALVTHIEAVRRPQYTKQDFDNTLTEVNNAVFTQMPCKARSHVATAQTIYESIKDDANDAVLQSRIISAELKITKLELDQFKTHARKSALWFCASCGIAYAAYRLAKLYNDHCCNEKNQKVDEHKVAYITWIVTLFSGGIALEYNYLKTTSK